MLLIIMRSHAHDPVILDPVVENLADDNLRPGLSKLDALSAWPKYKVQAYTKPQS